MEFMAIRKPAPWMSFAADRVLEYLDTEGPSSPTQMAEDDRIRFSRVHANKTLRKLQKVGLVEMVGNGVYRLTPKGDGYLAGQEDLRDVEEPE